MANIPPTIESTFHMQIKIGSGATRVSPTFFNVASPAFLRFVRNMMGGKAHRLGVLPLYAEQAVAELAEVFIGTEVCTAYLYKMGMHD